MARRILGFRPASRIKRKGREGSRRGRKGKRQREKSLAKGCYSAFLCENLCAHCGKKRFRGSRFEVRGSRFEVQASKKNNVYLMNQTTLSFLFSDVWQVAARLTVLGTDSHGRLRDECGSRITLMFTFVMNNPISNHDAYGLAAGCDYFPDEYESDCVLEACDRHDACWARNHCTPCSWSPYSLPFTRCGWCNLQVAADIAACRSCG